MRRLLVLAFVLAVVAPVAAQQRQPVQPALPVPQPAQPAPGLPAQSFGFFQCLCNTSPGAPLPGQLSFVPQVSRLWSGSVYATADRDAVSKAQRACSAERRGSLFDCINCRCAR